MRREPGVRGRVKPPGVNVVQLQSPAHLAARHHSQHTHPNRSAYAPPGSTAASICR
jgi:hypothetical protein